MQVTGPARTRLTILEKHFDFQRVPFPNFIGYMVNIFLVDVNLQSLFRIKRELAHLSDTRKPHNGHTRLNTKVLEGTHSLSLHFILNWNAKGTGRERERNGKGTRTEREGNGKGTRIRTL